MEPSSPESAEVVFDPASSGYKLIARPDVVFRRCSEFVESFFEPFDGRAIATKLVCSHPRYVDRTVEDLLAEWAAAGEQGTAVHGQIQQYLLRDAAPEDPRAQHAVRWLEATYPKEEFLRMPEVVVHEENMKIAGTTDLLVRRRGGGRWVLLDWKTNKKIETKPFKGKCGIRGPARRWPDCNYFKYSLQTSLYRYLLEEQRGLAFDGQMLAHLTPDGVVPYPCEYLKAQVELMVDYDVSSPGLFAVLEAL